MGCFFCVLHLPLKVKTVVLFMCTCVILECLKCTIFSSNKIFVHSSKARTPPGFWICGVRKKGWILGQVVVPLCWLAWAEWGISMVPGLVVATRFCGSVGGPPLGAPAALSVASVSPLASVHKQRKWLSFHILQCVTRVQSYYMSLGLVLWETIAFCIPTYVFSISLILHTYEIHLTSLSFLFSSFLFAAALRFSSSSSLCLCSSAAFISAWERFLFFNEVCLF